MNLTQKVLCYQCKRWTLTSVLLEVKEFCRQTLMSRRGWDFESADELYTQIEPKIIRGIHRFTYRKISFELYLLRIIYFQERSYRTGEKQREKEHRHFMEVGQEAYQHMNCGGDSIRFDVNPQNWPESVSAEEDWEQFQNEYSVDLCGCVSDSEDEQASIRQLSSDRKSVLLLALKNCEHLGDELLRKVSIYTNVPEIRLYAMREQLRECIDKKRRKLSSQIATRNAKLMQMKKHFDDGEMNERIRESIAKSNRNLSQISLSPTHRDISEVTGIPKGTVDSNIHKMQLMYKAGKQLGLREMPKLL